MKKLLLVATALTLGISTAALAQNSGPSPQNVPGSSAEGNAMEKNPGALTAPEANPTGEPATGAGSKSEKDPMVSNQNSGSSK